MYYQDYILNFSNSLEDHLIMQQEIYDKMTEYRLIFKIIKAHIDYKSQRVLGQFLTKGGRLPDPSLVKTICELQQPKTLQQIQSLLGLAQVAREYSNSNRIYTNTCKESCRLRKVMERRTKSCI
jgi:hypothetical protein